MGSLSCCATVTNVRVLPIAYLQFDMLGTGERKLPSIELEAGNSVSL